MPAITASELMQKLQGKEDILLLDVREEWEHTAFNIGGVLIPLSSIFENMDLIDRDKEVVVYCKKGIRSQIAIQRLQQKHGFDNLVNLTGGMEGWQRELRLRSPDTNNILE
jgi:adenylyltransferase/sulfurtransferase